MIKLFKQLRTKEWLMIATAAVFIVLQVWLDLKLPEYMSEITKLIQTEGSSISSVLSAGGWMLLFVLCSFAATCIVSYIAARVSASYSARIRSLVYSKVQSFSMAEIHHFSTGSLITRSTNDVTQIRMVVAMGLQVVIKAPIMAVWAITKIAGKSFEWTTATGVSVAVLLAFLSVVIIAVIPRFNVIQKLTDKLNTISRENLTGLRVIRAYNAESYQEKKFENANEALTKNNLFTTRTMSFMQPVMSLINNGLVLSIYWIGAILINNAIGTDKISVFSDMIVFSSYAMQVVMAFMMLVMIFTILPRASVSAKRINEVLDTETSIVDGDGASPPEYRTGEVEFRNVSFKYPGASDYILKNISFKAQKGETIAIIGSTGSGKSSLINLIPRFYDVTDGEILVDGMDVKRYKLNQLHNKLGYVSQKSVLFMGDITSNVAFGENGKTPVTEPTIKKAISIAQGTEFIEKMNGDYHAAVSQGGTNLSGGQKQRLSIARAVCRNPEIFIFDDSFSALDYRTDRELRSALKSETNGATSFIVSQRIGTIINADKIIVLEHGEVVGMGTHKTLLSSCEVYQEIASSQLSKGELQNE